MYKIKFQDIKNKIITNIRIDEKKTLYEIYKNTGKIEAFITKKCVQYIKKMFSDLDILSYEFQNIPGPELDNYVYSLVLTRPATNHPFVVYANKHSNIVHIIHPFGKDIEYGQKSLDTFEQLLQDKYKSKINKPLYYAFYLLFGESIKIRKHELVTNDKYSLLKCSNIKMCRLKERQIKKQRISDKYKKREIKKINMFYEKKARKMIKKYYDFLDNKNFQEAYNFLKVKKGKYFNKQRLDTFFINSKKIIGHLQILIEIYQFVFIMVDRYKKSD